MICNAGIFGMQTEVVYFCAGGLLFTGNYDTPLEEADAALRTFRSIYDEFNNALLAIVEVPSGPAWRTLIVIGSPPAP